MTRGKPSFLIALVIWLLTACSSGQTDDVQPRIAAVENSLLPAVIDSGSAPGGMALSDRMRHYRVPGVSIALINDGRIEWAKGYGVVEAGGNESVTVDAVFQACSNAGCSNTSWFRGVCGSPRAC